MTVVASRILEDAWELVQQTLHLLPNDALRARMHRALINELSSLQAKVTVMTDAARFTPWSFQSVAGERHEEWMYTLREDMDDLLRLGGEARQLSYRVNSVITVLTAARRILRKADHAIRGLFEGAEAPTALLERLTQHEAVYKTPNLPAFECSLVDDQIIAGRNPLTERDAYWLEAMRVTHVLDLREDWEWSSPRCGSEAVTLLAHQRFHLPITDMQAPSQADLDAACRFLNDILVGPRALVYIHCRAGRERTAAVLCAYFARRYGLTYDDALKVLQQRRPSLQPLPVQERAVRIWLGEEAPAGGRS